jgi:ubiquinone/menaquinone biosynthesis C-methylase UbiE
MNKSDTMNQHYLLNEQYKDASNFNERLHMIQSLSIQQLDWYKWIFSQIKKAPGLHVLELGCGPGYLWKNNLEHIPSDWDITLSDFSPGMLKEAHNNLSHCSRHFNFQLIDAQEIPFENAHFDMLIANLMLYHVPDRARAFAEIRRVLKPDGIFYAATVTETALANLEKFLFTAGLPVWQDVVGFSLENGAAQLASWFSHIKRHRLDNTLVVKDVEQLISFVRSGIPQNEQSETKFQRLRELLQQELAQHGAIYINMDIGLFEAANIVV